MAVSDIVNAVTAADVKRVFTTRLVDDDVNFFLSTAQSIVSEELPASGHSEVRLREITKYLAAHFLAVTEEYGNITRVVVGDTEQWMDNGTRDAIDKGFALTRFGQQALVLDTTGTLAGKFSDKAIAPRAELRVV